MSRYASSLNRCPECRRSFRTLDDEVGMHECPHCGYFPDACGEDVLAIHDPTCTSAACRAVATLAAQRGAR